MLHCRSLIGSLHQGPVAQEQSWLHELDVMELNGVKAEIESAHSRAGFGAFARDLAEELTQFYQKCLFNMTAHE